MYEFQNIKHYHNIIENINDEIPIFQKDELSLITNFGASNDSNYYNNDNKFLKNKREKADLIHKEKKHTKFSYDNLKRKCKHLVIENVMDFINNKIYEAYDGNISISLTKKKLMKLNQSPKTNADLNFSLQKINNNLNSSISL